MSLHSERITDRAGERSQAEKEGSMQDALNNNRIGGKIYR